ncbi:Helitron like N domain-containing protein, partial [Aphis craccivora]
MRKNVFAMVRQEGQPTLFLTFSPSESTWTDLLKILYKLRYSKTLSDDTVLTYAQKSYLIRQDPVVCATYFDHRFRALFKLIKSKNVIFKEHSMKHFFHRVEYQHRGSPYVHMLLWLDNAPVFDPAKPETFGACVTLINKYNKYQQMRKLLMKINTKLTTLEMRKNLIRNVKSLKVTADMVNSKWAKDKVFINERLTKFKRMLFSQTRLAAKNNILNSIYVDSLVDIPLSNDSFSVFQINISSIKAHFNDVVTLLGSVNNLFSVIVLCETWLLNDFEFKLNGYKTINSLGTLNKCDGVTVLVRESLNIITVNTQ